MFEFDAGKLIIIGIVALIFIGPKDLPRVMRYVGQAVGRLRRMGAEFQSQFMEAMNETGVADLKADVSQLAESTKVDLGPDPVSLAKDEMRSAVSQIEAPHKPAALPESAPLSASLPAPETEALKAEIADAPQPAVVRAAANE